MPSSTVTLGSVTFQGHEVPEEIPFGGDQRLVKQRLVGGRRVVDAMGPDEGDRKWRGRFRGPEALARARAVDRMRQAGAQVPLSWGGLFFTVVIERFRPDYRRSTDIPYEIECVVVDDPSPAGSAFGGIGALISGDLGALGGLAGSLGGLTGEAVGALGGAIDGVAGSLDELTGAALVPLQDLAAGAVGALDGALSAADAALGAFGGLDPAVLAAPELFAAIGDQALASSDLAVAAEARGLAGRIEANLSTIPG